MKIVIDARILGSSTGIYVENLLNHLQQIDDKNDYVVLLATQAMGKWVPKKSNFTVVPTPYKNYSFGEQIGLAWQLYRLSPDLVHFCMPQQPLLYFGRRVTTVHDLTLVRYENIDMNPYIYRLRKKIFTFMLKNVVQRSKAVLVPTDFVKKDVLSFTSQRYEPKVVKTLEAGDPLAAAAEPVAELAGKHFIFFVGNAFPYKNLNAIVDAFALLYKKHPDLHLAFAGKKDYFYDNVAKYAKQKGVAGRTHILGFISEGQKRWMFQNTRAYVVASLSEGFHIPGLEAMYEGCPVISSNASCLPEVNGDAALYFNPFDHKELAANIEKVLSDFPLRQRLVKAGKEHVKKYSWRRMAEQTLAVYKRVLKIK